MLQKVSSAEQSISTRLAPFLVLLEARYLPLLLVVMKQAYTVYLWLYPTPYSIAGEVFAIVGALGYEFVYVGAVAWAEEDRFTAWTWATALIALIFSVFVAFYVHQTQGSWAWLHVGFPLVGFAYTMNMYSRAHLSKREQTDLVSIVEQMRNDGETYESIARELNMSKSAVYRVLNANIKKFQPVSKNGV